MRNLVVIYKSQFLHDIYLIKHKLEVMKIKCYTRNENVMATIGVSVFDQYKLMIDENDVQKALELIEDDD